MRPRKSYKLFKWLLLYSSHIRYYLVSIPTYDQVQNLHKSIFYLKIIFYIHLLFVNNLNQRYPIPTIKSTLCIVVRKPFLCWDWKLQIWQLVQNKGANLMQQKIKDLEKHACIAKKHVSMLLHQPEHTATAMMNPVCPLGINMFPTSLMHEL